MQSKKSKKGLCALLRELSDNEDETASMGHNVSEDPNQPWLQHFHPFIDAIEQVPDGWSAMKWWGVSVLSSKA